MNNYFIQKAMQKAWSLDWTGKGKRQKSKGGEGQRGDSVKIRSNVSPSEAPTFKGELKP